MPIKIDGINKINKTTRLTQNPILAYLSKGLRKIRAKTKLIKLKINSPKGVKTKIAGGNVLSPKVTPKKIRPNKMLYPNPKIKFITKTNIRYFFDM